MEYAWWVLVNGRYLTISYCCRATRPNHHLGTVYEPWLYPRFINWCRVCLTIILFISQKKTPFGWFYIIYFTYLENPKIVAFVGEFRVIFQLLLFQFLHGCHQLGLLSQRPCNRSRTSFRFIPPTPQPDLRPFCVGFLTITTIWGVVVINCPDFWWILGKESCSSLPGLHKTKCFGTCFVYGKCVPLDPEWRMKWEQWWLWPTMPPALPPRT